MQVDLTLKNYRCFPDSHPTRLAIRKGFTALVGLNNSGKSSLLKFFYEFRELFRRLSTPDILPSLRGSDQGFNLVGISDIAEVFSNENSRNLTVENNCSPSQGEPVPENVPTRLVVEVLRNQNIFKIREMRTNNQIIPHNSNYAISPALYLVVPGGQQVAYLQPLFTALQPLGSTTYLAAFRNAINVGGNQNYFDIRIGEQFLQAWRSFKTGAVKQQAEAAYRLTDDIRHIFGFATLEINTSDDNRTLQVFVDGRAFRLEELGSGLAQFILVLANVATRQQAYILLDEPELNLHPTLQIDFLTTIASYSSEGVIFGTHSIGLARAVGQQVYSLKRLHEGVSEMQPLEATPRLAEFLGELSFSGYRELGFQRMLLVEGTYDVTTIQQFLRKRNLDHKIVCLHLGGAAMIGGGREAELAEVQRISPDLYVLIDSERNAEGEQLASDRQAFIDSCKNLGITCHALDRRAIENYFSERAIKAVKGEKYRALAPFEKLRDATPAWAKAENWRIAREMTLDELKGTDLGQFLESL